jgi:protein-arginine kinase activator protein McsA
MTGINCSICGQANGSQATTNAMYCANCYSKYYINIPANLSKQASDIEKIKGGKND